MVFKVYCGKTSQFTHERKQIDYIVKEFQKTYEKFEDEFCYLFLNVYILGREFDVIVIKKDKIIILDLKSYKGKIIADCKEKNKWTVISSDGESWQPQNNHFFEARNRRGRMAKFLRMVLKWDEEKEIELLNFISSWIIVEKESEIAIENLQNNYKYWFSILPIDETIHNVTLVTTKKGIITLNEQNINDFINMTIVEERDPDYWMFKEAPAPIHEESKDDNLIPLSNSIFTQIIAPIEKVGSRYGFNRNINILKNIDSPKYSLDFIDIKFKSENPYDIQNAIEMVKMLYLPQYIQNVLMHKNNPYASVRVAVIDAAQFFEYNEINTLLTEFLYDIEWEVRKKALEALISTGNPEVIPVLINTLNNNNIDEEEIFLTAKVLGEVGDKRAVEPLIDLSRGWEDRFPQSKYIWSPTDYIISVLGSIGSPDAIPFLKEQLENANWHKKSNIIEALGKIGNQEAIDILLNLLESETEDRGEIIYALADTKNKDVAEYLHPFLQDKDLFRSTIRTLGIIDSKESFEPIWEIYEKEASNDNHFQYDRTIIKILIKLDREKTEEKLLSAILEGNDNLKLAAAGHIDEVVTTKSETTLKDMLADENLHYPATHALIVLYKDNTPKYLFEYLESKNEFLREAAGCIIGFTLKESGLEYIAKLRNDKSELVKQMVIHVFKEIGNEECVGYLVEMLEDDSLKIRRDVLMLLNNLGFETFEPDFILPKLRKVQESADDEINWFLADIYGKIGTEECLEYLFEMLQDEDSERRQNTLYFIDKIGKDKILPKIQRLHLDPNQLISSYKFIENFALKMIDFTKDTTNKFDDHSKRESQRRWQQIIDLIENLRKMEENENRRKENEG